MLHFSLTIIEIVDTSKLHMRYVHESISSKIGWVHHKTAVSVSNASYSSSIFFFSSMSRGKKEAIFDSVCPLWWKRGPWGARSFIKRWTQTQASVILEGLFFTPSVSHIVVLGWLSLKMIFQKKKKKQIGKKNIFGKRLSSSSFSFHSQPLNEKFMIR